MKMFSDCSGECCVCACGGFCLAGHGDDDFSPATNEQILARLKRGDYTNCFGEGFAWIVIRLNTKSYSS